MARTNCLRRSRQQLDRSMLTARKQLPARAQHNRPSRLLKLPGEIKNRIYRHVLVSDSCIIPQGPAGRRSRTALLHVSRQVREEASSIYYEENTFSLMAKALTPTFISKFRAAAGASANNIREFRVSRRFEYGLSGDNHYGGGRNYFMRFAVKKLQQGDVGVEVLFADRASRDVSPAEFQTRHGRVHCYCMLEDSARELSDQPSETSVLDVVERFLLSAVSEKVTRKLGLCQVCVLLRGVSPEGSS